MMAKGRQEMKALCNKKDVQDDKRMQTFKVNEERASKGISIKNTNKKSKITGGKKKV